MSLILILILSFLSVHGLWFLLFRSPLIPHLSGILWGKPYMTNDQLSTELLVRGYFRRYFLWLCTYCQAVWAGALYATLVALAVTHLPPDPAWRMGMEPSLLGAVLLLPVWLASMPILWLMQKPYGHNSVADGADLGEDEEELEEKTKGMKTEVRSVSSGNAARKLTPEEQKVMRFFGLGPCDFEGWEELREEYQKAKETAEADPDCPPCKIGEIVREFREKVRVKYGFTKEQVPDLLPGRG